MSTTTTEASEAQTLRLNTAEALKLVARATDLSLVVVNVASYGVQLSFRRNSDAATFAERIDAHDDVLQNDHEHEVGGRARWWTTGWRSDGRAPVQVVGWGESK